MTLVGTFGDDARRAQASDWIVRLQAADLAESEAMAFDGWLSDPANGRAYDSVVAVTYEYVANATSGGFGTRTSTNPP